MEAGCYSFVIILFEWAKHRALTQNLVRTLYFLQNLGLHCLRLDWRRRVKRDSRAPVLQPAEVQHRNQWRDGARRDREISD
jgi:hypothetical protein